MPKKTRAKRKPRKVVERDGKLYTVRGVELTRCSNTKTEAEFFAFILSHCRRLTNKWKPAYDKLEEGKRPNESSNKRLKWEYSCEICNNWFPKSFIDIDHIVPCGGINGFEKIEPWFRRALVEKDSYQRLCKDCHKQKTQQEKQGNGR
tara:strand:+ start:12822 stop:13265 length:444 start_codon:yes stop_codon:yes gene_type:complete